MKAQILAPLQIETHPELFDAIKNVMVVAHPDDETLWGWRAFESNSWLVVCVTDCGQARKLKFQQAVKGFGAIGICLGLPDIATRDFNPDEREFLIRELTSLIQRDSVEIVVTHGPEGEYGHPIHKSISEVVSRLVPSSKLKYFAFQDNPPPTPFSLLLMRGKALQTYFGYLGSATSFQVQEHSIQSGYGSKVVSFMVKVLRATTRALRTARSWTLFIRAKKAIPIRGVELSNLIHSELSQFAVIRDSSESMDSYNGRAYLVLKQYEFFYAYHDRRYLALNHYPTCLGRTLSVGVHIFNKDDWLFMGNPKGFETLELDENYSEFGSPNKHTTGDFLEFNPNYKFQDIVLFGVMGIPQDTSRDSDSYSLFKNESAVIEKADELLEIHGRIAVGPDLNLDYRGSRESNLKYWMNFFSENKILKERYLIDYQMETQQNLLVVFRKLS